MDIPDTHRRLGDYANAVDAFEDSLRTMLGRLARVKTTAGALPVDIFTAEQKQSLAALRGAADVRLSPRIPDINAQVKALLKETQNG